MAFPHTTLPLAAVEVPEVLLCATPSREENAREVTAAGSPTVMRKAVEEAVGSRVDTTPPPAGRLARAMPSREESARGVMVAVTTTARRVLAIPPRVTTVVATGLVACASPSRRASVSAVRPAASPTRQLSPQEITHLTKCHVRESSVAFPHTRNSLNWIQT